MKESYEVRPSQSPWPRRCMLSGNCLREAFREVQPGCVLNSEILSFEAADLVLRQGRQ